MQSKRSQRLIGPGRYPTKKHLTTSREELAHTTKSTFEIIQKNATSPLHLWLLEKMTCN